MVVVVLIKALENRKVYRYWRILCGFSLSSSLVVKVWSYEYVNNKKWKIDYIK
jgi:hypothetical protein